MGKLGQIHHQVFALGQELMQRRIERADHHREAVHRREQPGEILALHGQQLDQRLAAVFSSRARIIACTIRQAVFGEEHVLGAAQADAFGAERARGLGIARDVGIGAHAELAAELVRPLHELGEVRRLQIGLIGLGLAEIDLGRGAVDRDPVALLDRDRLAARPARWTVLVCSLIAMEPAPTMQGRPMPRATTAAWLTLAADRGENALGHVHAVNVVRRGFLADQNHRASSPTSPRRRRRVNATRPTAAPGEAAMPVASFVSVLSEAASNTGCSN